MTNQEKALLMACEELQRERQELCAELMAIALKILCIPRTADFRISEGGDEKSFCAMCGRYGRGTHDDECLVNKAKRIQIVWG